MLVLNCNGKVHLEACLSSVLAQTGPQDRVYLIDNGSIDGSIEHVRKHYRAVKVIGFERNLGFAEAYNRAIASVGEDLVVLLNNDVQVGEGWLVELKSGLERSANHVAACGSKILFYHNRGLINHTGGRLVMIGGGIDLDFMKPEQPDASGPRFVGCVSEASMIVSRSVFLKLGGFDSDFFAYFEDVDFCWRAWLMGYRVLLIRSSRVYHKLSATMGPLLRPERVFLGERNRLQSLLKNLEPGNALVGLFVLALYNLTRMASLLRSRKPKATLAIIRADWWAISHLSRIVAKRRQIQGSRRVSDDFLISHRLMASLAEGLREFRRLAAVRTI